MVSFQVRRASAIIQSTQERAFEPLNLRTSEATLLIAIGENPGCTQADLARSLRIKPANVVPLVTKLLSEKLIERAHLGGRAVALHLTPGGADSLKQVRDVLQRQEDEIMRSLPGVEKGAVLDVLKAIARMNACGKP
jgi:DNA-binding MarR family transcriptional regulator